MVQWLGLCASTVGGTGLISGWGTNILHAAMSPCPRQKSESLQSFLSLFWAFMMPWACAWLSRFPGILRSFSKPSLPRISLPSFFFLLSCLLFASTVDFCPRWQQLVHLAVNIFEECPPPWGQSKIGETRQAPCVVLQGTHRHVKTNVIPWEQGFLYSLQYQVLVLGTQTAILKTTMWGEGRGKAKLKCHRVLWLYFSGLLLVKCLLGCCKAFSVFQSSN